MCYNAAMLAAIADDLLNIDIRRCGQGKGVNVCLVASALSLRYISCMIVMIGKGSLPP